MARPEVSAWLRRALAGRADELPVVTRRSASGTRPLTRRIGCWLRRFVITMTSLVAAGVVAVVVLLLVTPSVGDAESIARAQAMAHQAPYPGPAVPYRFAAALVATEDQRFYNEPGVDPIAISRVLLGWLSSHGGDQGGATLYLQLAKQLYTPGRGGLAIEAEQMGLGLKLKVSYGAAGVLRMYAAVEYFGHGYYGLAQASCGYFGRQPAALSWPQAAMLAGLVQAPSAYDPLAHPDLARARQSHVVARLVATGVLTAAQARQVLAVPVSQLIGNAARSCRP